MKDLKATFLEISNDSISKIQDFLKSLEINENKSEKKFRVVASTEDLDRSWEIIKANGWKRDNFMKNPVIIANHVYKIENIVGKATKICIENGKLVIEWVFSQSNPLGVLLSNLYQEWMVKTVSVGFIPKERDWKVITSAELLELSFVAVPCNPNALSLDQKQLLEDANMLEIKQDEENEERTDANEGVNEKLLSEILSELKSIKSLLNNLISANKKESSLDELSKSINAGITAFTKVYKS